ncbi:MAG: hypothetical protein M3021_03950, partial [Actinomycetota bacterium]|nr:hypothetical protein [Actinomycetota bacterium]
AATGVSCSSTTNCTATSPAGSGSVHVTVTVAGQTSSSSTADQFTYIACQTAGLAANPVASATVGATVTLTATSTGCSGTPQYRFWVMSPTMGWGVMQDYSAITSYSWYTSGLAASSGYQLAVTVRGQGSTTERETAAFINPYALTAAASTCQTATLTANPTSTVTAGTTVSLAASSSGCSGTPQYRFWVMSPSGAWAVKQDYSPTTSYSWNTTGLAASPSYQLAVTVRSQGSIAERETAAYIPYSLTAASGICQTAVLTASPAGSASVGATVALSAGSTGCGGTPQYRFWVMSPTTGWAVVQDFSPAATYSWNTAGLVASSGYELAVTVRSQGSTTERETAAYINPYALQ